MTRIKLKICRTINFLIVYLIQQLNKIHLRIINKLGKNAIDNPQKYEFSGKRVKRGLYQTKDGRLLNADVNGALNILSKSKVVDLEVLYNRGELDTPVRIRVA